MLEISDLRRRRIILSCSENKGADQLCSYCTADLCLCFRIYYIDCWFSYVATQMFKAKFLVIHVYINAK